jgi:predicted HicB family RNase H-like nuclease
MIRITDEPFDRGIQLAADTNTPSIGLASEPLKRRDVYLKIVSRDRGVVDRRSFIGAQHPRARGGHFDALTNNVGSIMMDRGNGVLSVQLGSLKQDWFAYCRLHGISPSDATRQVIRKLVGRELHVSTTQCADAMEATRVKVRVEVRVTAAEHQSIAELAAATGFSVNSWIVALIRAQLTGSPQLGQGELEQLASSNSRLLAIGRNLNQIARALNAAPAEAARPRPELIVSLASEIKSHTAAVAALIQSNVQRWSR